MVTQLEPTTTSVDPALRRIAVVLRRNMWWIAVVALAAGAIGYTATSAGVANYRSESVVELTDAVAVGISSTGQKRGDARVEIEAQRRLLESSAVLQALRDELGHDGPLVVSTSSPEQTPVIVVGVEAETPELAEQGADAIVGIYVAQRIQAEVDRLEGELEPLRSQRVEQRELVQSIIDELNRVRGTAPVDEVSVLENRAASALGRLDEYDVAIQEREFFQQTVEGRVRVIEEASAALDTASSPVTRAVQFALLAFFATMGLVIGFSRLRGRLLLLDEVRAVAGRDVPILATVPRFAAKFRKGPPSLVVGQPAAAREAEAFRYARSAIEVAAEGMSPLSVLITSSSSNEGKTVTSSNLALASARSGRSTALLDGDLLNSSVEKLFVAAGLTNAFRPLLAGDIDPHTQAWHHVGDAGPGLDVMLAPQHGDDDDRQELSVESVSPVLRALKKGWDVVIVDGPPVLAVSDAMILARAADITVLIVRIGTTSRRDLETAITQLRQGEVSLGGIIVTQTRERSQSYYGSGYGYTAKR